MLNRMQMRMQQIALIDARKAAERQMQATAATTVEEREFVAKRERIDTAVRAKEALRQKQWLASRERKREHERGVRERVEAAAMAKQAKDLRGRTEAIERQRQQAAIKRLQIPLILPLQKPERIGLNEKGTCGFIPRVGKVGDVKGTGRLTPTLRIPNADLRQYAVMALAGFVIYSMVK